MRELADCPVKRLCGIGIEIEKKRRKIKSKELYFSSFLPISYTIFFTAIRPNGSFCIPVMGAFSREKTQSDASTVLHN